MKQIVINYKKMLLISIMCVTWPLQNTMAQPYWPFVSPKGVDIEGGRIGAFTNGSELPNNVKPDATVLTTSTPIDVHGVLVRAGIMSLEPRNTYIMFNNIHSGPKISQTSRENAFYWAPVTIGLTSPLWSANGQIISFREGFRSPERGDASSIMLWDLKSSTMSPIEVDAKNQPIYWPSFQWSPGSRYLTYLRGGSAQGDFDEWASDYDLFAYDTKDKIEKKISLNTDLFWSWTNVGSILTAGSQSEYKTGENALYAENRSPIYEINVATLKKEKLLEHGAFPYASPDNQWVAFFDWKGPISSVPDKLAIPKRGLYLWRRSDQKVFFINQLKLSRPPLLQWSLNSKEIYVVDESLDSISQNIYKFDGIEELSNGKSIDTGAYWHKVAAMPGAGREIHYSVKGTSTDGRLIFIDAKKISKQDSGDLACRYTLSALDTQSGALFPIVTDSSVSEVDQWEWREGDKDVSTQLAVQKLEEALPAWAATLTGAVSN